MKEKSIIKACFSSFFPLFKKCIVGNLGNFNINVSYLFTLSNKKKFILTRSGVFAAVHKNCIALSVKLRT